MAKGPFSLDRLLNRYNLGPFEDLVKDAVQPAVCLDPKPPVSRSLKIGASKFGGLPHLEEGTFWPLRHNVDRPLQFMAQINLADLPDDIDLVVPLPREGWLYFWLDTLADWEASCTRLPPVEPVEYPYGRITYAPPDAALMRVPFPMFDEPNVPAAKKRKDYVRPELLPYSEHRMLFRRAWSLDKDAMTELLGKASQIEEDGEDEDIWSRAFEMISEMHGEKPNRRNRNHRLLGWDPEAGGEDIRAYAQRTYSQRVGTCGGELTPRNRKSWIMLAKFESDPTFQRRPNDPGWSFSDAGCLCYCIRRSDLEKLDFSKAVAVIINEG
ncbi:DUF1963 domain-containing protein [Blastopirellula marina]|uniref:DUF1963 domain-containing protein n=1 Tax=Blastopirellula marina TaxID=124 RepID=A0A2S8GQI9_9BACT|nr:DUF1963 domain-containing protein [Blastopirellula marina]PQO46284.1 hypothetical protein C5Y93_09870 [Blastopirellula marina]